MSAPLARKDLFAKECSNPLVWILVGVALLSVFLPGFWSDLVATLFFFVFGCLCLLNFRRCKRYHCVITGVGFQVVGLVSLLVLVGAIDVAGWLLWGGFISLLAISYLSEFRHSHKPGSCYCE